MLPKPWRSGADGGFSGVATYLGTSQLCPNASHEYQWAEWLFYVVVGTEEQSLLH